MAEVGRNQLRSRSRSAKAMTETKPAHNHKPSEGASGDMEGKKGGGKVAICCFLGIFISYFIYGLVQEKM